jgi:putative peptide maturation dehydrogenase
LVQATTPASLELKRSRYFLVQLDEGQQVDIQALLQGHIEISAQTYLSATSMLTEAVHRITSNELALLGKTSAAQWRPVSQITAKTGAAPELLERLVRQGLLISNSNDAESTRLRRREERFAAASWHPYAALYHLMIKYPTGLSRGARPELFDIESIAANARQGADRFIAEHGKPPPAFHQVTGIGKALPLPSIAKEGGLYQALANRRTVRTFDRDKPLRIEDVAVLLRYVFGCHGYARLSPDHTILRRTSPSGGSLHPIEAYPLIRNVSGIDPGLYHYNMRDHTLTPLRGLDPARTDALVTEWAAGQAFAASAPLLVALTARFRRNFWKYPNNVKTHSVVLLDAAHLSQTFYLVCSDLGLGSFFVAHDGAAIERTLSLDGIEEGSIALVGCGVPTSAGADHGIDFLPFEPGKTVI